MANSTLLHADPPSPADAPPLPPADPETCARWRQWIADYVSRERLVPPLSHDELSAHATWLIGHHAIPEAQRAFVSLLISNAVWQDVVAAVPFERRLLLLPLCLSNRDVCRGERDDIGLICAHCGGCELDRIVKEAHRLGMVTLIAEGATVVRMLLADGRIDAVLGVGCIHTLERIFPAMSQHAIPGLAIPLLTTGCHSTTLDCDWLFELLHLRAANASALLPDLDRLHAIVHEWMTPAALAAGLAPPATQVERLARDWLAIGGKRWRPLLTAAVYAVLRGEADIAATHLTALAVESLHKASLIHDDIEDGDASRYGQTTLHITHGIPIAINVGDYLIGEGYRLLLALTLDPATQLRMLQTVAAGHHALCQGQGEELAFAASPGPLTLESYTRLCERKTGAAFEVAILLGAIQGGADEATCEPLRRFSRALGVAYQIRDDLADATLPAGGDLHANRPSILLALACESEDPRVVSARKTFWMRRDDAAEETARQLVASLKASGQLERAGQLAEHHLHAAERALSELHHGGLKRLLRRIASRLLEPAG
jgi:geranylgeranyl diphosphate synthase type II